MSKLGIRCEPADSFGRGGTSHAAARFSGRRRGGYGAGRELRTAAEASETPPYLRSGCDAQRTVDPMSRLALSAILLVLSAILLIVFAPSAAAVARCPNGSYVNGNSCKQAPDGSYISGEGRPYRAPNGTYTSGHPVLTPKGNYIGGNGRMTVCPDGTYVLGKCHLTPNGTYVGD
jgi:hypothetical protein